MEYYFLTDHSKGIIKEIQQLKGMWDPGLDAGPEKKTTVEKRQYFNKACSFVNSVLSMLMSRFGQLYYGHVKW